MAAKRKPHPHAHLSCALPKGRPWACVCEFVRDHPDGATLDAIALALGVHECTVRRAEASALEKLGKLRAKLGE